MQTPDGPDLPDLVGGEESPAGHEAPLSGAGAWGTTDVGAASVVPPSDELSRRERIRRRLRRRIPRPDESSDVDVIRARLDVEQHRTPAQRWLLGEDYRDRPDDTAQRLADEQRDDD